MPQCGNTERLAMSNNFILVSRVETPQDLFQVFRDESTGEAVRWAIADRNGLNFGVMWTHDQIRQWKLSGFSEGKLDQVGAQVLVKDGHTTLRRGGTQASWACPQLAVDLVNDMRAVFERLNEA